MSNTVISVEHLSKQYDLGVIGTGTLTRDFERWWARTRGKPDPYSPVTQDYTRKHGDETILALDDVSFTVQQGEALGIIGRNGAGKSTLLKILSRVTAPTSGVVKVKGRIGSLLEVGTGFHPELTGRENVFLNGAILGMKKAEVASKFDEIVAFSGVEKFIDTPVKRYSSGMYVRLAFAVAAHLDPEILIVDEVLAVGDAEFQKKCLGKMGDVAEEGRTILFVSHNLAMVKALCSTGLLLYNGQILQESNINSVIDAYMIRSEQDTKSYYEFPPSNIDNGFHFCTLSIQKKNSSDILTDIPLTEGFDLIIDYRLTKPIAGMNIAFHLYDMFGQAIFSSTDVDSCLKNIEKQRDPGKYTAIINVPSDFLRAQSYILGVSASIPNKLVLADYKKLTRINVVDSGSPDGILRQHREGIINPILEWKTTLNDDPLS